MKGSLVMTKGLDRAWVEVDLDCIAHNFKEIRRMVDNKCLVMAVVKADAYGHGAVEVSRVLVENGVDRLAVANIDEAIQLRENNINVPIQIFGRTYPCRANEIIRYELIQTIFDEELAQSISESAIRENKSAIVHIKINTGMNRVGFAPDEESVDRIIQIASLKGLNIEGIMTHF